MKSNHPIILYEAKNSNNSQSKYLFYPSESCLSPYSKGNNISNYNIIKQLNRLRENKTNKQNDINKDYNNYIKNKEKFHNLYNKKNNEKANNNNDLNENKNKDKYINIKDGSLLDNNRLQNLGNYNFNYKENTLNNNGFMENRFSKKYGENFNDNIIEEINTLNNRNFEIQNNDINNDLNKLSHTNAQNKEILLKEKIPQLNNNINENINEKIIKDNNIDIIKKEEKEKEGEKKNIISNKGYEKEFYIKENMNKNVFKDKKLKGKKIKHYSEGNGGAKAPIKKPKKNNKNNITNFF